MINVGGKNVSKQITELKAETITGIINVKTKFGAKGDGVTDDTAAFESALLAGNAIFAPEGTYKVNLDSATSNKEIFGVTSFWDGSTLVGGTVIVGTLKFTGKDIYLHDFAIKNTSDNGIYVTGNASNVRCDNIIANVYNHGFLIEQNGGTCKDVVVKDCEAYNSIHGFVSKAENVKFINCKTYGTTNDGFVLVSDNINGASQTSLCKNNQLINCEAKNSSSGILMYSRDYTSENNAANILLQNVTVIGGVFRDNLNHGIFVGDTAANQAGRTYNAVKNVTILGATFGGNTGTDIRCNRYENLYIDGCNIEGSITRDTTADTQVSQKYLKIGKINKPFVSGNVTIGNVINAAVLTVNSASPSMENGDTYFETANTASTFINSIQGGKPGQIIFVKINDNFTYIIGGTFLVINKYLRGSGSVIALRRSDDNTTWNEIWRMDKRRDLNYNYATTINIGWNTQYVATSTITGNCTVNFAGGSQGDDVYTLILNGDTNPHTITWGSGIKWIGSAPTTLAANTRLITQFYFDGSNYLNVNTQVCAL